MGPNRAKHHYITEKQTSRTWKTYQAQSEAGDPGMRIPGWKIKRIFQKLINTTAGE